MRIHTSALSTEDLHNAARLARVNFTTLNYHGSRKRNRAFEVKLTGDSPYRQNGGDYPAATWDQWGIFLNALFRSDPDMTCSGYKDAEAFHYATCNRFHDLTFQNSHRRQAAAAAAAQESVQAYIDQRVEERIAALAAHNNLTLPPS